MYVLEKKNINDYTFFVIRNEKNFKIVDFFVFSPINYYPIFEQYITGIVKEILMFNFDKNRYSNNKFKKALMTYKIDVKNKKISFRSSYFFDDIINYLEPYLSKYKIYLENKKTVAGINAFFETNLKETYNILEKSIDKKVLNFFDYFKLEKKTELITEIFNLYFEEEYEKAISNSLKLSHKKRMAIQEYNHIANKLKYFAKGD